MSSKFKFNVLSFNCWGEPPHLLLRTLNACDDINILTPDIICLQELFAPYSRIHFIDILSKDYYYIMANHTELDFPKISYIPFIISSISLFIIYGLSPLVLISLLLSPPFLFNYFIYFMSIFLTPYPTKKVEELNAFDFMGTAIFVKKSMFKSISCLSNKPFSVHDRKYLYPQTYNPFPWVVWWFSTSFLRSGFLLAQTETLSGEQLLIVNCHLVVGLENPTRLRQLHHIHSALKKANGGTLDYNKPIIWAGDFNAGDEWEEHNIMKTAGFKDSADVSSENLATWSQSNVYTSGANTFIIDDGERKLDYVWYHDKFIKALKCVRVFDKTPTSDHYGILATLELNIK